MSVCTVALRCRPLRAAQRHARDVASAHEMHAKAGAWLHHECCCAPDFVDDDLSQVPALLRCQTLFRVSLRQAALKTSCSLRFRQPVIRPNICREMEGAGASWPVWNAPVRRGQSRCRLWSRRPLRIRLLDCLLASWPLFGLSPARLYGPPPQYLAWPHLCLTSATLTFDRRSPCRLWLTSTRTSDLRWELSGRMAITRQLCDLCSWNYVMLNTLRN